MILSSLPVFVIKKKRKKKIEEIGEPGFICAHRMLPIGVKSAITVTHGGARYITRVPAILITGLRLIASQGKASSGNAKRQNQFWRWPNTSASQAYLTVRCWRAVLQFHSHGARYALSARCRYTRLGK